MKIMWPGQRALHRKIAEQDEILCRRKDRLEDLRLRITEQDDALVKAGNRIGDLLAELFALRAEMAVRVEKAEQERDAALDTGDAAILARRAAETELAPLIALRDANRLYMRNGKGRYEKIAPPEVEF